MPEPVQSSQALAPVPPTEQDRTWAMATHLLAALLAGFIAPLVVMLTLGEKSPFVRRHAVHCLNFQLTLLIAGLVSAVLVCVGIGIVMLLALIVVTYVFSIIAAVKAYNGKEYTYPLAITFFR